MSSQVTVAAAFEQAFAHEAAGRYAEADAIYARILAAIPEHPGALLKLAQGSVRRGEIDAARERLARGIAAAARMGLPPTDLWLTLARLERSRSDWAAARAALERARAVAPDAAAVLQEEAGLALDEGDAGAAERALRRIVERDAEDGSAWTQLALALERQDRIDEARAALDRAMQAGRSSTSAWVHAARLATRRHDFAAADRFCRDGLARDPRSAALLYQHGVLLKLVGQPAAACETLGRALQLAPDDPGVLLALGAACVDARRHGEACSHLRRAIELGAQTGEAWDNLGLALRGTGDEKDAVHAFERAVALAPALTPALANLLQARQQMCAWDDVDRLRERLLATLADPDGDPRWPPFIALGMDIGPEEQLAVARRWSSAVLPRPAAPPPPHPRGPRLRVGYLSSDFREHPTGRLMAALFEEHDRDRFEIFGYSYGPDDGSELRARIRNAFHAWRDLDGVSDAQAARLIREDGIDVLIDRKGLTQGARLEILAPRPAPVQLHYMSFPGTIGYDAIDGLIADDEVVPPGDERFYHERVWRLPRCYFVNDSRRPVPRVEPRERHGLPADALVLSCFNQGYKLTRPVFSIWLDALRAAPRAVLWLLAPTPAQQRNLHAEARHAGVDPERIVFAPLLPQAAHMDRVGCADLTLDTLPYNQHTTACDSLWAGVPVLTCRGTTFAGRVGASLLRAAELPQLVTHSLDEYRARLLGLLSAPAELARYREHLLRARHRLPLFDTASFARDWEALLLRAYEGTLAARHYSE